MSSLVAIEQPKGLVGRWGAWVLLPILFIHAAIRFWVYEAGVIPFNADEAIVALMARHINQLKEIPVFFYGQDYMGSLDAILVAIGFRLFGEQVVVVRLVQFILYCLWAITSYKVIFLVSKSAKLASISSLFYVIPTVNVLLYTSVSLGGYGEALVLGNCILLIGLAIQSNTARNRWQTALLWFFFGLLVGFGFWVFGLTLVYSAAVIVLLIYSFARKTILVEPGFIIKHIIVAIIGLSIGLLPVIYHLLTQSQTAVLSEILGSAIAGNSGSINFINEISLRILSFLILGLPVVIGIRPPWSVEWLVLPLIPGIIFFWTAATIAAKKARKDRVLLTSGSLTIILIGLITIFGFIATPFGNDPSGRYFLPLYIPMIWIGSLFIISISARWKNWIWILPGFLIAYNLLAITQVVRNTPPGLTTQFDEVAQIDHKFMDTLIVFLRTNKITRGYTNYWVSYPLAFLSQEELIFLPSLPYHEDFRYSTRDRRYPPYEKIVSTSQDTAYITTNHSELDNYLRTMFTKRNVRWQEKYIGDYHIFYKLSAPVHAGDIGLGDSHE